MQATIGLKKFRENLGTYEKLVKAGHSFVIVKHAKPIFTVGPVEETGWETVIDFTKWKKDGISANDLLKKLKSI